MLQYKRIDSFKDTGFYMLNQFPNDSIGMIEWRFKVEDSRMSMLEIRKKYLGFVLQAYEKVVPDRTPWLFIAAKVPQEDTRINRYLKYWGLLARRGINLPSDVTKHDSVNFENRKIKFKSAIRIDSNNIDQISALQMSEDSIIILSTSLNDRHISRELEEMYCPENGCPNASFVDQMVKANSFIVSISGEFDDPEIIVWLVGKEKEVEDAYKRLLDKNFFSLN